MLDYLNLNTILEIMVPMVGTTLGAACVFFLKGSMPPKMQKIMLGFASGVMVAASVWSLLIPSMDMSEHMGKLGFVPAVVGFLIGMGFLLMMDQILPHLHVNATCPEGMQCNWKKNTMMFMAITLHNVPEGCAVGVILAGAAMENSSITLAGALALSIGIAVQNFPEGAIISLNMRENATRTKSFLYGMASGAVEPLSAIITLMLARYVEPFLPYFLSFAAGAMIYVVVEELIPESNEGEHSNLGTVGFAAGFVIMMILDVVLG
ncbi:MAG: ZIP family metal transporter [Firmicutes bacterium]|nr:ZIP family metal transporter [Bacillota bacterium]